jgi:hypothetical protein
MVSLSTIFLRKPVPKMVLYIFPSELFIVFPNCFHGPFPAQKVSEGHFLNTTGIPDKDKIKRSFLPKKHAVF